MILGATPATRSLLRLVSLVVACVLLVAGAADALETISGTVRAEQGGAAIEAVDLDVFDLAGEKIDSATASTDALGQYTVTLPGPGSYLLRADPDVSQPFSDQYLAGVLLESDATAIAVALDEAVTGIDVALPAGVLLSGRVTSDGAPLAGVVTEAGTGLALSGIDLDVFEVDGDRLDADANTVADGSYELGVLLPGSYLLRADPAPSDGFAPTYYLDSIGLSGATPVVVSAGGPTSGIDFALEASGTISGTIVDTLGAAVDAIDIDVYDAATDERLPQGAVSGLDGSYRVDQLKTGSYKLRAAPRSKMGLRCVTTTRKRVVPRPIPSPSQPGWTRAPSISCSNQVPPSRAS